MKTILTVCSLGLGSSLALKMQIQKALQELAINAHVENIDTATAISRFPDFVFTSPEIAKELKDQMTCPIIEIKQFMNYDEVLRNCRNIFT